MEVPKLLLEEFSYVRYMKFMFESFWLALLRKAGNKPTVRALIC